MRTIRHDSWLRKSQIITVKTKLIKPHSNYRNVKNKELEDRNFGYQAQCSKRIQVIWLEMWCKYITQFM